MYDITIKLVTVCQSLTEDKVTLVTSRMRSGSIQNGLSTEQSVI